MNSLDVKEADKLLERENFPGDSDGKESTCNSADLGLILGSEISPGEGSGKPTQLENFMDRGA